MMTEQDWERLARYVSGEASPAERAEVERWIAASTERKAMLDSVERRWAAAAPPHEAPIDRAWARLASKLSAALIGVDDEDVIPLAPRRARWSTAAGLLPLAAVLLVAVGVTALWRSRVGHGGDATSLGTPVAAALETRTGVGQRRTIDLPDGSRVALGATSMLRVGERFVQGQRDVYLEGQALFTVRHDSLRPFVVHAAGTVTEDLGTEFDVRAYPGDSVVRVVVAEGAVAVRREGAADTALTLRPGDVAKLGASGATLLREQNVERLLAWASGEIVFDDTPLSEVAEELERWFDIECRIADSTLRTRPITVNLRSSLPLDELLRIVGMSTNVRAERDGRVVTFTRGTPRGTSYRVTPRARRVEAGG